MSNDVLRNAISVYEAAWEKLFKSSFDNELPVKPNPNKIGEKYGSFICSLPRINRCQCSEKCV